ncbi:hypothetical protein [Haloimpatiens massiliensis]|uniref:hypothetical protein n=1 Tax=Haloimpatiens massiliensis TaxID=1658110 RepID=UPI000C817F15|nr:hypothetical protein [Haloimpatiens massiliensis]
MGNIYESMCVASNCSSFKSQEPVVMSSIGTSLSKRCSKCSHCKNCKCELDLYDNVISSIDEK